MPQLIDPSTGDIYDVADEDAEREQSLHGLVTQDEWRWQNAGAVEKASDTVQAGLQGVARGAIAPGMAIQRALTGEMPAPEAGREQSALGESVFGDEAQARRERHETVAGLAESAPAGLAAAATGGAGLGVMGTAGALGTESAFLGTTQEAVDAVTQKRDFSAKAALMNGLLNLAVGGALHVGLGALGGASAAAEAGSLAGARATAEEAGIPRRNLLNEIDPGTVPEARTGGTQSRGRVPQPESVGAAASSFDDLDAARAIREIKTGKVAPGPIAGAAPAIREQLSVESARSADALDSFLRDDANLAVKHQDFAKGAAEWTPEIRQAQDQWLSTMEKQATETAERVRGMRHAGGLGEAAANEIEKGLERARDAAGAGDWAGRNVAVDNMKRGVDGFIGRLGRAGNSVVDEETRAALIRELRENLADPLREGLENPAYFGRNAEIQVAHNQPIHELIEPLSRVQRRLYEVTGRKWGEVGVTAVERRADPDAFRRLFEDPHAGGKLFQKDLSEALDRAESLARNRAESGLSHLEGIDQVIDHLQQIRNDLNTAQVLKFAEGQMGGGAHGAGGASAGAAIGSNVILHAAEYAGRAVGFPLGNIARSTGAMAKGAYALDQLAAKFGGGELAKAGTATRSLLDRYAARVKGSELLADEAHTAGLPENLKRFLDKAHAQGGVPPAVPPTGGAAPPAPGGAANDTAKAAAGMRWQQTAPAESVDDFLRRQRGEAPKDAPIWEKSQAPKLDPKLQPAWDALSRSKEPMTKGQLGEALGRRGTAEWEVEQLQKQGLIRPISPEEHAQHPAWSVETRYAPVFPGGGKAAVGLAVAGGAGALLASQNAGAAELLPDQQKARDEYQQRLSQMGPDEQAASLQAAETFARLQQRTTSRVESAVDALFSPAKGRDVGQRSLSRAQREIDAKAEKHGVSRATARFMGKTADDLVSAWQDKSALVSKAVGDPMGLARVMAQNMGDLPHAEPEVFGKMVAQTLSVLSYLHDTMPTPSGKSVFDPQGYPPTDNEIQEWAARWSGALHPLDALDDLAVNDVQPETMEAVESQWPDAKAMFQQAAFKHIHELGQRGKAIPFDALEQLDRALDLGGAGEPLLSPDFAAIVTQARAQSDQQAQSKPPPQPIQSKEPERMTSSALATLHGG